MLCNNFEHLHLVFMVCEVTKEDQSNIGIRQFLVRQLPTDFTQGGGAAFSLDKDMIPKYVRTRRVIASSGKIGNKDCISFICTCSTFFQKLVTCRHVFAVTNRTPTKVDVFPECHKAYEEFYGKEGREDYTGWVRERTQLLESLGGKFDV